jgi:ComF family protein
MLSDLLSLLYPVLCSSCGNPLRKGEECICSACLYTLPETGFHLHKDNPVARRFWGKIPLVFASSCYYFRKGGNVQHLIHGLKYAKQKETGLFLGRSYGHLLREQPLLDDIDALVPVPLHPRKLRQRGYNQSEVLAEGIAEVLGKPVERNLLLKTIEKGSQTNRSRYSRWENTAESFTLAGGKLPEGRHLLLVDDVITTGSTLESCASRILSVQDSRVSIVTIACALL